MRFRRFAHSVSGLVVTMSMVATSGSMAGAQPLQRAVHGHDSLAGTTITEWATPEGAHQTATTLATYGPLVAQFKKQTGITVKITVVPWPELLTKLTTAVATGSGPDISETGDTWAGQLARTNGFVPWTAAAYEKIGGKGKFIPRVIGATGLPGQTPAELMLWVESYALYYNKLLFEKAGITSPPRTWAQFIADAQKITSPKTGVWGTAMDLGAVTGMETWDWILSRQFGGHYYSSPTKDKATVNNPGTTAAMNMFLNWMGSDHIMSPVDAEYNNTQAEAQFGAGKVGMVFEQGETGLIADGIPAKDIGVGLVPMRTLNPPASAAVMSHLDGVNIAIFKSSKHLAADYAWLKFLTDRQAQTAIAKSYGVVPSTVAAARNPYFQNNPEYHTWLTIQSKYAVPMPTQADSGTLDEATARAVSVLFDGVATSGHVSTAQVRSALDSVESAALAREASS
jgi:multiple sugar transport system substrate-binding protein